MSEPTQEFPSKEDFSPSQAEIGSHLRGVRMQIGRNKLLLIHLRSNAVSSTWLRRELRGRAENTVVLEAHFIVGVKLCADLIVQIEEEQITLEEELRVLDGQLRLTGI